MNNPEEKLKLKKKSVFAKRKNTNSMLSKLGEKSDIYCLESLFATNLTIIFTNRLHAAA